MNWLTRCVSPRRWSRSHEGASAAAVAIGVLIILGLVALHGFNKIALNDGPTFSLDRDWSVSFIWTISLFAAAAWLWWRHASAQRGHQRTWFAMATLCGLLAVEGAAQLHVRLEAWAGFALSQLVIQPLLAVLVVGLFVVAHRHLPSPERHLLAAAAISLALAELMSIIAGQFELAHAGIVLLSVLEESFEMLTGTLLVAAPLPFVLARRGRGQVSAESAPL